MPTTQATQGRNAMITINKLNLYMMPARHAAAHSVDVSKLLLDMLTRADNADSVQAPARATTQAPAPGAMWPEQGGIYLGVMPGVNGQPGYHLITPATDEGANSSVSWGGYGKTIDGATCERDGLSNTLTLIDSTESGPHPAATWARNLVIGEHTDFYLPSHAEAMLGWIHAPQLFQNGPYWTSTQYSALSAWAQGSVGRSSISNKLTEFKARAVRRSVIE